MRVGADARRRQVYALCATHLLSGRARFPALRSGTRHASRNQHWLSPRSCFLGPGYCGRHPPVACPSPARSAQTGRFAGPTVSRAARVRGYESRPRAPHSLHHRYVTGDAPRMSEMDWRITEIVTRVKRIVSTLVTALRGVPAANSLFAFVVAIGVKRKSTGRQIWPARSNNGPERKSRVPRSSRDNDNFVRVARSDPCYTVHQLGKPPLCNILWIQAVPFPSLMPEISTPKPWHFDR
jgi:hypothetical protein